MTQSQCILIFTYIAVVTCQFIPNWNNTFLFPTQNFIPGLFDSSPGFFNPNRNFQLISNRNVQFNPLFNPNPLILNPNVSLPSPDDLWKQFKITFRKLYTPPDDIIRHRIFRINLDRIIKHNKDTDLGLYTYRLALNPLCDQTIEELKRILNGLKPPKIKPEDNSFDESITVDDSSDESIDSSSGAKSTTSGTIYIKKLPNEVDWRKQGLVTSVKTQRRCGSCWAFTACGALEGQYIKKYRKPIDFSEQYLVDCAYGDGLRGCRGGIITSAYKFISRNKGICTETEYPYVAKKRKCHYLSLNMTVIKGYKTIPSGDEESLKYAVAKIGPVSVGIDSSQTTFFLYGSGIYYDKSCSPSKVNHGVLLVGYGTENGIDYWLIKNSWSEKWGEKGYMKLARNKDNHCGIASYASYPIL